MVLIGGYTERMDADTPGKARGISAYDFHPGAGGELHFLGFAPAVNPSYLRPDRKRGVVYAVSERESSNHACVTAHRVRRNRKGKVEFEKISEVLIKGDHPCQLTLAGGTLLVSSYTNGMLHVIGRAQDGALTEVLQDIQLTTSTGRGPHAHCTAYDRARQRVYLCDLGDDKLKTFTRAEDGRLTHVPGLDLSFATGEGPRHVVLHADGDHALVNGECIGVVHLVDLTGEAGPAIVHTANALPERVIDEASGAAIRIGPKGKMVYVSDRTFSVINRLRLDVKAGKLSFRDSYASGGESPRDFSISADGEWLLAANSVDSTVGVFRVDPKGNLTHYRTVKGVPTPTSIAWW